MKHTNYLSLSISSRSKLLAPFVVGMVGLIVAVSVSVKAENPHADVSPLPAKNLKPVVSKTTVKEAKAKGDIEVKKNKVGKKEALLGVGGASVSKALSIHLGLEEGVGVTLFHIMPDSPASKAGLEAYDILTRVDEKKVGSQVDLRRLIQKLRVGDEVSIDYIHKGKRKTTKLRLAERPAGSLLVPMEGINKWMFEGLGGEIPEADRKMMEEQMRKHVKELKKQLKKEGLQGLPLNNKAPGVGKNPQGANHQGFFSFNSTITIHDKKGTVILKTINGKKEVVVKNKEKEVIFEGPYDTDQDKAAVPDDIKERIKALHITNGKKIRLQINPGK